MISDRLVFFSAAALLIVSIVTVSAMNYTDDVRAERRYILAVCVDKIWPDYKGTNPCGRNE
jgi:hypothetical protein